MGKQRDNTYAYRCCCIAFITCCLLLFSAGIYASDWAGTYKVKSLHSTLWVTRDYFDNFEMTIKKVDNTYVITSMFGEDLTTNNHGGFVINVKDDGSAVIDVSENNILRLIDHTTFMYKLCIFDEQYYNRLSEWNMKMNNDGTITVGTFFIASYQWSNFWQKWGSENIETMYYDMTATKEEPSSIIIGNNCPSVSYRVIDGSLVLSETAMVSIRNTAGQLVFSGHTCLISNLPKGIYFITINTHTSKVLIK